eukprot:11116761-Alexandrium_andersonii.AAC.1
MDAVVCAGANGAVGSRAPSSVRSIAGEAESVAGRAFRDFLLARELLAPSAYARYTSAEDEHAFTAESGAERRIAFAALGAGLKRARLARAF